ncbi:MAG: cardiolipin synthase [Bacteroidales bacterium]
MVLYILNQVLVLGYSLVLIFKKRDPVKTLSWILVMILLPYVGLIFYLFLGRNFRKEKMFIRKGAADLKNKQELAKDTLTLIEDKNNIPTELKSYFKLIVQNLRNSYSLLTPTSSSKVYFSAQEAIDDMLIDISNAKTHIHFQSFIVENDKIGKKLKDLLIKKSKEGVEVRFMVDGYGSNSLPKRFFKEMKTAGIEILVFSPFRWLIPPLKANYRNHRKLLIIDGEIGYLGGVNVADRYYDGGVFQEWRDTHVRMTGRSVYSMQSSFILDRYFIINKNLRKRGKYYPDIEMFNTKIDMLPDEKFYSQIISSGPDSNWAAILHCYITALFSAKENVYINTPYFIPNETLLQTIKIVALSNVNVSIMLPEKADTKMTNWASRSYVTDLLNAGVKVYFFKNGFNHSKTMSIDGEYCMIGSANFDMRSLETNFEITSVIYDSNTAQKLEDRFRKDLYRCTSMTKFNWKHRPWQQKLYESFAKLISPML